MPISIKNSRGYMPCKGQQRSKFITPQYLFDRPSLLTNIPKINHQNIQSYLQQPIKEKQHPTKIIEKKVLGKRKVQLQNEDTGLGYGSSSGKQGEEAYKIPKQKIKQILRNKDDMEEECDDDNQSMYNQSQQDEEDQEEYQRYEKPSKKKKY